MEKCQRCEQPMPCDHEFAFRFGQCLNQYEKSIGEMSRAGGSLTRGDNGVHRTSPTIYSRPGIEYIADFESVARRALAGQEIKLLIFRYYFCEGRSEQQTMGLLARAVHRTEPSTFRDAVRAMKIELGRAFSDVKPYPIYPTWEYLHQSQMSDNTSATIVVEEATNSGMRLVEALSKK